MAKGRRIFWSLFLLFAGVGMWLAGIYGSPVGAQSDVSAKAVVLTIEGPVGPPMADYLSREMKRAAENDATLIVLEMDTPGGLDASMRDIIKDILSSPIPVASFVSPSGSRAASAGTYIMYASHIAAMAPGTNLGSATPVQIGGGSPLPDSEPEFPTPAPSDESQDNEQESASSDESAQESVADESTDDATEDSGQSPEGDEASAEEMAEAEDTPALSNDDSMRAKVINDASAYIKGLAELRGRNAEWAVKAVREAANLNSREAAEINVIDFVADDLSDLLEQSHSRVVEIDGEEVTVNSAGASIERVEPDWATKFLAAITDPNVAFLLMTLGFYGLFFELANPGSIVPGTFGLISLILGLYALSVLPVSMAGAGLLLLGVILMIAEAFAPSFGAMGIGGLVAFGFGATMLFDTDAPGFTLDWQVVVGTTVVTGLFVLSVMVFAIGAQSRRVVTGKEYLVRQKGVVEDWDGSAGWILVEGERWRAVSNGPLEPGQQVKIKEIDGLTLVVQPA